MEVAIRAVDVFYDWLGEQVRREDAHVPDPETIQNDEETYVCLPEALLAWIRRGGAAYVLEDFGIFMQTLFLLAVDPFIGVRAVNWKEKVGRSTYTLPVVSPEQQPGHHDEESVLHLWYLYLDRAVFDRAIYEWKATGSPLVGYRFDGFNH